MLQPEQSFNGKVNICDELLLVGFGRVVIFALKSMFPSFWL